MTYQLYKHFFLSSSIHPHGKYVRITDYGFGFGYALVIELDKQGFSVFASVCHLPSEALLKKHLSSRKKTHSLHALANNAGIVKSADIDWMMIELIRQSMDVNFFGHVLMTKTFLPLLICKRDSGVINVSSSTSFISFGNSSAYSVAKYALELFFGCHRREMAPWSLRVSIIQPGGMRTPFLDGQEIFFRNVSTELPLDIQQRSGEEFSKKLIKQLIDNPFVNKAEDPLKAVRAIQHAVMDKNPQIRYRPHWQAKL